MSSERYYVPDDEQLRSLDPGEQFVAPRQPPCPAWKFIVLPYEFEGYIYDKSTGKISAQMRIDRYGSDPDDMRRGENAEDYMMRKLGWVER